MRIFAKKIIDKRIKEGIQSTINAFSRKKTLEFKEKEEKIKREKLKEFERKLRINRKNKIKKFDISKIDEINTKLFKKVYRECLNISNEKILIVGDIGFKESLVSPIISKAYYKAAKEEGYNVEMYLQNTKSVYDFTDQGLVNKFKKLPKNSIIVLNMSNKIGKLSYLGSSYRKFCKKNGHRFISASGLKNMQTNKLNYFLKAIDVDYKKHKKIGDKIKKKLDNGSKVNILTEMGTDLEIDISGSKSINSHGIYKNPGEGGNIPTGETYIPPTGLEGVKGRLVIDGCYRTHLKSKKPFEPIKMEIKKGSIISIDKTPEGNLIYNTLKWARETSKKYPENVSKIGELGIGYNKNAELIGATIIDEKAYNTCHLAIGSNNWFGGDIRAKIHLDQVIKNPKIYVDDRLLKF